VDEVEDDDDGEGDSGPADGGGDVNVEGGRESPSPEENILKKTLLNELNSYKLLLNIFY